MSFSPTTLIRSLLKTTVCLGRGAVLILLLLFTSTAQAQSVRYDDYPLPDLAFRLPTLFGQFVRVEGSLTAWGATAVLGSKATGEVMVDLSLLDPALGLALNTDCAAGQSCQVAVSGEVVHIRGGGISELGIRANEIQ